MVANQRLVAHAVPGINAAGVPEVGTSVTVTMKYFHVDVENVGKYS